MKEEEISEKIKSFSENEAAQKEQWEKLLKLRISRNALIEEIKSLTNSNNKLANQEANLLNPSDLNEVTTDISSPTLKQTQERVTKINQIKQNLEAQLETLSANITKTEDRKKEIPDQNNKTQTDLAVLKSSPEPAEEINSLIRLEDIARLESELKKLELEDINIDRTIPILKINRKTLRKDDSQITSLFRVWNDKLINANKNTAASIKADISKLAKNLSGNSLAKELADQTITVSNSLLENDSITSNLRNTRRELDDLKLTFYQINEQQKYAKERINLLEKASFPIDRETGTLLRKQRSELPTEKDLSLRLSAIFQESTVNELAMLKEREQLDSINSISQDAYEKSLTKSQKSELTNEQFDNLITSAKQVHLIVINERKDLSKQYRELVILLEKTIQSSKDYSLFIDTRLLWIVSHPPLGKQSFIDEFNSLKILYGPASFAALFTSWKLDIYESPILWILFCLLFIVLISIRKKLYLLAKQSHQAASRSSCTTFLPTLTGLISIIILSLPIPFLLTFLAWRTPSELPIQAGLYMGGFLYLTLGLLRRMCKIDGFLESNKMIYIGHLKLFRKVIKSLIIILPLVAITSASLTKINAELIQGRLFNMVSLIIMAAAMHCILLPKKRILSGKKKPSFLSYFAYIAFVIFPLVLVVVTASGHFISMLTLKAHLNQTIQITLLIFLVTLLLKRWLLVSRRRAILNSQQSTLNEPDSSHSAEEKKQEIQEKVSKVSEQSNRLIRLASVVILVFSILTIWSETLPALSVLDDIKLWETSSSETSSPKSNLNPLSSLSGSTQEISESSQTSTNYISLQDLLVTVIVSFLTYLAAVNIPSLLEITILNHLKLQQGSAYTVTTSIRYIIIIGGIIWAFGSIGVSWDKIQWLAAAITLGIGFGLQEIFANFVAGIILLYERPIRIGDLVTIGDINGKVSKIQMRATTILQFNNRELIVPNKEFITGQLVNWTLSDNVIRAEIFVGIAYNSDTELAKSIMLDCAKNNPRSLKDPEPSVVFNSFGASSLDFSLRTFISSVDDLIPVQSELHFAVDNAFREAGIVIAFPQQDINIRSITSALPSVLTTPAND